MDDVEIMIKNRIADALNTHFLTVQFMDQK